MSRFTKIPVLVLTLSVAGFATQQSVLMPALIADALIVAGVIYDMRTRGRPHPA